MTQVDGIFDISDLGFLLPPNTLQNFNFNNKRDSRHFTNLFCLYTALERHLIWRMLRLA